jgi:hypothetical protein
VFILEKNRFDLGHVGRRGVGFMPVEKIERAADQAPEQIERK